jgi:hypothetical protein
METTAPILLSEEITPRARELVVQHQNQIYTQTSADLMVLWIAWDPKLKELGLVSNQDEGAKAMYTPPPCACSHNWSPSQTA